MRNIRLALQTGAAVVFAMAFMPSIMNSVSYAQDRAADPQLQQDNASFEIRQNKLRMISREAPSHEKSKLSRGEVLTQAREDFLEIQVANKSLRDAASAKEALNFKFVSDALAQISIRAARLNTNLTLPKPKAEPRKVTVAENPEDVKSSILNLSKLVRDFVTNPCFTDASSLSNTDLTTKARLDLENIIALSKQLQKDSEKFGGAPVPKSP